VGALVRLTAATQGLAAVHGTALSVARDPRTARVLSAGPSVGSSW
jgi:hypothetical protein